MNLRIKETLQNYKRVLSISKKPDREEFFSTARICLIGIGIIGIIGFLIYMIAILIGL
ncbi:MAG: protein translocase SEC61 complex subunit gamma [Candidatus Aenigmarchaeota archaeon]|nr:protein translocase SEC61 complex subunit gamma [Candidatus Aenigmarchaeota archaeon]